MAVKKFILIVFLTVFLTLIKKGHNYPCPFSLKGSENSAGSGYRSVKTDIFFSRLSKKIDNVIPDENLIFMITTKRNKIVGLMPKAQLKNPRRIFSYVDDIITVLASIRKLLNSFGTDKLNIPKKYTIFQMKKIRQIKQVHNSVAKLTPPPSQLFLFSSMYDLLWGEGKKIQKKTTLSLRR